MLGHFIYFIIALLIVTFYEPMDEPPISLYYALSLFIASILTYGLYVRTIFQRLSKRVAHDSQAMLDRSFSQLSTRCSILSILLLIFDVWFLHLPSYLRPLPGFSFLPTLTSLIFLLLFVGYLTIIWTLSYDCHKAIYKTGLPRKSYVYSNIALCVPVLIPWTFLFGIQDIIRLLPSEIPKRLLDTFSGQIGSFLVFLIIMATFAPVFIQRFWRCRPLEKGEHRSRIETLCKRAKVRYADIVYWPIFGGRMITAGVMGIVSRFRYILVTDALLKMLSPDEIDQVMAHEIGHVKHRHLWLYFLFISGFMLIAHTLYSITEFLFSINGELLRFFLSFDFEINEAIFLVYGILLLLAVVPYFRYLFGYFIRNFERQADISVFNLFASAHPLISTFDKIVVTSSQPADKPNWHHFSIKERIDYLKLCEASPSWIAKHHRKIKKSISAFIVGMILLAGFAYFVNVLTKNAYHRNQTKIINEIIDDLDQKNLKTKDDALLYLKAAGFYYTNKKFERAVSAYEASLRIIPDNPEALNNIAWLLATEYNSPVYNPERALKFAQRAIALKKAPHIWDTLAQCYFVNGYVGIAIEAQKEALKMDPPNRKIYEKQLEIFKKAQKKGKKDIN